MKKRTVRGTVTEITEEGGAYVKEGYGSWFLSKKDLGAVGITEIKIGDMISFTAERTPCGGAFICDLLKV